LESLQGTHRTDDPNRHNGDAGELAQSLPSERLAFHRQAPPLVGQALTTPSQLLTKNAVLLQEVVDDLLLMAVDPAGECEQEVLQGDGSMGG